MGSAKDIVLRPISAQEGNRTIKRLHYSGKVTQNSQLHIGVYYDGALEGAIQFGPSLDKRKIQGLVPGTGWNDFLELNRLAFSDRLPRNSESRALGISLRLLRREAPQVKWVVSFADATQCGDGTIYRAAGFVLTGIKTSDALAKLPSGEVIHKMTLHSQPTTPRPELGGRTFYQVTAGRYNWKAYCAAANAEILPGHQLRYIYFVDPAYRELLAVPELPFSAIAAAGATMYRGARPADNPRAESLVSEAPADQAGEDGANPISALQEDQQEAPHG
jgi:hypothetical protein